MAERRQGRKGLDTRPIKKEWEENEEGGGEEKKKLKIV